MYLKQNVDNSGEIVRVDELAQGFAGTKHLKVGSISFREVALVDEGRDDMRIDQMEIVVPIDYVQHET